MCMLDYRPDRTIVGHAGEIRFCVTLREVAQSAAYPGLDHETPVTFSGPAGLCLEGWENVVSVRNVRNFSNTSVSKRTSPTITPKFFVPMVPIAERIHREVLPDLLRALVLFVGNVLVIQSTIKRTFRRQRDFVQFRYVDHVLVQIASLQKHSFRPNCLVVCVKSSSPDFRIFFTRSSSDAARNCIESMKTRLPVLSSRFRSPFISITPTSAYTVLPDFVVNSVHSLRENTNTKRPS